MKQKDKNNKKIEKIILAQKMYSNQIQSKAKNLLKINNKNCAPEQTKSKSYFNSLKFQKDMGPIVLGKILDSEKYYLLNFKSAKLKKSFSLTRQDVQNNQDFVNRDAYLNALMQRLEALEKISRR